MDYTKKFGKGALREPKDKTRPTLKKHLKKIGAPVLPASYDLSSLYEQWPVYCQNGCEGCSGFAGGHYAEIKTFKRDGTILTLSKKDIYQNIFQKGGGAYGKDLMAYLENSGVCLDKFIPTNMPDGEAPTEQYMETIIPRTADANTDGFSRVFSQAVTFNGNDINEVKQAIYNGDGALCALLGTNACWISNDGIVEVPSLPPSDPSLWGHFLILLGYDDSKQQIKAKSSWGDDIGDKGYFYIPYSYFTQGYVMSEYTLVELPAGYVPSLKDKIANIINQMILIIQQKIFTIN